MTSSNSPSFVAFKAMTVVLLVSVGVGIAGCASASHTRGANVSRPSRQTSTTVSTSQVNLASLLVHSGPPGFSEPAGIDQVLDASTIAAGSPDPTAEEQELRDDGFQRGESSAWFSPSKGQRAVVEVLELATASEALNDERWNESGITAQPNGVRLVVPALSTPTFAWEWTTNNGQEQFAVEMFRLGPWLVAMGLASAAPDSAPLEVSTLATLSSSEYAVAVRQLGPSGTMY